MARGTSVSASGLHRGNAPVVTARHVDVAALICPSGGRRGSTPQPRYGGLNYFGGMVVLAACRRMLRDDHLSP